MQGKRHLRFTIYDLRFVKFARVARDAERRQAEPAYVRFTMDDVRFEL